MTIAAHDDEVRPSPLRLRDQLGRNIAAAALGSMQGCVYPVMLEVINRLGAEHSLIFGRALLSDDDDRHLLRLVQERHSFGERACGFPAAIPRDQNAIESD